MTSVSLAWQYATIVATARNRVPTLSTPAIDCQSMLVTSQPIGITSGIGEHRTRIVCAPYQYMLDQFETVRISKNHG